MDIEVIPIAYQPLDKVRVSVNLKELLSLMEVPDILQKVRINLKVPEGESIIEWARTHNG